MPEIDEVEVEPTWDVTVYTHTKEYRFSNIGTKQKDALWQLRWGTTYEWEDENGIDFIWYQPVERVEVKKRTGLTETEEMLRRLRRRTGLHYA